MRRPPIRAAALAVLLALAASAPRPSEALSVESVDDLGNGYRALTQTFYRGIDGARLLAGARGGLARAVRAKGGAAPGFAPVRSRDDSFDQIVAAVDSLHARVPLSDTELTYAALDGMARAAGDRYTVFLTPQELTGFEGPLNPPHVYGIGVVLQQDEKTKDVSAAYVAPGTPADAAGVRNGDVFVAVDGTTTHGMDVAHVRSHLLGRTGTVVRLEVQRDGRTRRAFSITRAEVHAPTVYQRMLPNGIGYIAVGVFGEPTAEEFAAALRKLHGERARAYVIDLRNNGGGYVNAAVAIAGHFIHAGPIVSVATRGRTTEFDGGTNADESLPVAVLVNHYSASASEITAGALQDAGVATLVGSRTYGKGVVQELNYNRDGSAMKVTTARYLTPHKRIIDGIGLAPDVPVTQNAHPRYGDPLSDAQLAAAIAVVRGKARI